MRKRKSSNVVSNDSQSFLKIVYLGKFMQLPMNRIRQIINLDEDSQMISKEALVLITKATELFV